MTDIPNPAEVAEVAEANRVKDEAADDALLEAWLPAAVAGLREFRGGEFLVSLPGVETPDGRPIFRTSVRKPDRFVKLVRERFAGTGWDARGTWEGWSGEYPRMFMAFESVEERERRERAAERAAAPGDLRRAEPEPTPRRPFWSFLRGNP